MSVSKKHVGLALALACAWPGMSQEEEPIAGLPETDVPAKVATPSPPPPQANAPTTAPGSVSAITGGPTPEAAEPPAMPLGELSPLAIEPDWKSLEKWAGTMTRSEFEAATGEIYRDKSPLPPPWRITGNTLVIKTGIESPSVVRIPFREARDDSPTVNRTWRRARELPPLEGRPPLSDIHIALDPGHIGGGWARMEERFLSFKEGETVQEGDLSLMTAKILVDRLRELGAYVSLVRENLNPVTEQRPEDMRITAKEVLRKAGLPFPEESYGGIEGDAKILTVQWQAEKLFYRVSEIRARAEKVNREIKPDVVLCLHFNAEGWGDSKDPQYTPKNHLHVLVNGCYAPSELARQDVRFEMMSRLLGRIHEEEIPLADAVAEAMAKAEPFVMNHKETYQRLLMGHYRGRTLLNGKLRTSAIEDYVRGVVRGLLNYYAEQRPTS
jgi:N-acetylmuramoyl-L-alanine amidase